jgi:hypothetical protein
VSQAKAFSLLTEDVVDLGLEGEDLDKILGIAEMVATLSDDVIVFVDGPVLQKWDGS